MKGIYLTEEGKKAIEDRVAELEEDLKEEANPFIYTDVSAELNTYKRILCYATILPTQRTWESLEEDLFKDVHPDTDRTQMMYAVYPNGVIITDKKP